MDTRYLDNDYISASDEGYDMSKFHNEYTGKRLTTGAASQKYKDNWDAIFAAKKKKKSKEELKKEAETEDLEGTDED